VFRLWVFRWEGEGGEVKSGRGKGEKREWVWLIGVVWMGEDMRLWWREEGVEFGG